MKSLKKEKNITNFIKDLDKAQIDESRKQFSKINKEFLPMYGLLEVQDYLKKLVEETNASGAKANDSLPPTEKPRSDNSEFISCSEDLRIKEQEQNIGGQ